MQKMNNACGIIEAVCTLHNNRVRISNISREFKADFNIDLARESGAHGLLFDEKS
jgi:hypothetical protein